MSLFQELKRRNVIRIAILYMVSSWVLLQLADVLTSLLNAPEAAGSIVVMLLILGFFPALIFAWVYEMTPDGLKREKEVDRTASITHETGQRLNRIIIGVLVIAVGVLLVDRSMPDRRKEQTAKPVADAAVEAARTDEVVTTGAPSIAVLPFANMSADESSTYFSDGLADTLLHMLAQIREIRGFGEKSVHTRIRKFRGFLNTRELANFANLLFCCKNGCFFSPGFNWLKIS